MRKFFTRILASLLEHRGTGRRSVRGRVRLAAEELENRVVPAVALDSITLVNGTQNGSGEWECTDPTISGIVQNAAENHNARIEIDHDGDGNAESTWEQAGSNSSFQYDPRSVNAALSGAVQLRIRALELDDDGTTVLNGTDWVSLSYNILSEPEGGGGDGDGDGDGGDPEDPPEQFVLPTIDAFAQTEQAGDWCIFTGHVSGSAVIGATVTFSGILDGLTATVDGDGNFTTSGFFPTGVQGIAYAQVIDGQGNTSEMVSLYVDIPNATPGEGESGEGESGEGDEEGGGESGDPGSGDEGEQEGDEGDPGDQGEQYVSPSIDAFAQTEQAGDWYIFTGHVGGSAVNGATVTFSGILDGLTSTVDGDGNFTTSGFFPTGVQGIAYAQVTDGQGNTSEMVSLYVDIPNYTL